MGGLEELVPMVVAALVGEVTNGLLGPVRRWLQKRRDTREPAERFAANPDDEEAKAGLEAALRHLLDQNPRLEKKLRKQLKHAKYTQIANTAGSNTVAIQIQGDNAKVQR